MAVQAVQAVQAALINFRVFNDYISQDHLSITDLAAWKAGMLQTPRLRLFKTS